MAESEHVGLSWFVGTHRGHRTIGHGGSDVGFRSKFLLLPEEGIGLVLASNYVMAPTDGIQDGILDIVLGHEPAMPRTQVSMAFAKAYEESGLEAAKALYRRLEAESPDEYDFGNRQLNAVGYIYLGQGQAAQAIEILGFNVELFPDVANTHDSLGEAYMANGDVGLAAKAYRRSLELDPDNDNARKMLAQLGD